MADKGWTAQIAAAAGVAAGTGAAQLGLGYGLGVVVWPATSTDDNSVWLGSLGWATWIAASATVFGAVIASRLSSRSRALWRLALAASAAVGALVSVALIALPARDAVRVDTVAPQTIAAGYAIVGILLGVVLAYWAVSSRPVAANLILTAAWLWALAVAAIVVDLIWHRPTATYLSSWQFAGPSLGARYGTIYWPSSVLTLLAALVIGVLAVWPAVRRGEFGVGAATSGAVGPLLVAGAFFALAPRLTGALGPLESAYLIAPYAVLAGLAGSAMTVAIGRAAAERQARERPGYSAPSEGPGAGSSTARQGDRIPRDARLGARASRRPSPAATGEATVPAADADGTSHAEPDTARDLRREQSVAARDRRPDNTAEKQPEKPAATARSGRTGWFRRRSNDAEPAGTQQAPAGQTADDAPERAKPARSVSAGAKRAGDNPPASGPAAGNSAGAQPSKQTAPRQATPGLDAPRQAAPRQAAPPQAAPRRDPPGQDAPGQAGAGLRPMQAPPVAPAPTPVAPSAPANSTVAPPPASPPVAKINPSASETRPVPRKTPAKKAPRRPANPANDN
jgi:hypothetical protein